MGHDAERGFVVAGLSRNHWRNATPIRRIVRTAFEAAGFEYPNPHKVRKTLARLGEQRVRTPEEWKAWSQNHRARRWNRRAIRRLALFYLLVQLRIHKRAVQICQRTAFALCPRKSLSWRVCLICLKKTSIDHRQR